MKNSYIVGQVIFYLLIIFLFIGWVKCIVKMTKCNWEPVGKAEVLYSVGVFTPLGTVIGWIDIEDK